MKPEPEIVELDVAQLEAQLGRIEQELGEETARPFRLLLNWYLALLRLIQSKNTTIGRLRRLLFGARTERTRDLPGGKSAKAAGDSAAAPNAAESQFSGADDAAGADSAKSDNTGSATPDPNATGQRRRRGHGRRSAKAYTGCQRVVVTHASLRPGDLCPDCHGAAVYRLGDWSPVVRLKGQPPVGGTLYELERLRCGLCGKVITAELPDEAGSEKYDPTVASIIATLRYGQGLPWNRIERMQRAAGIPLPASVQWEVVRDAAERGPAAVYQQLLWEAAQGSLLHNDDTHMRILELTAKVNHHEPPDDDPQRRGVFTTGILSIAADRPTIALFFTGPRHSGENLRDLLGRRMAGVPPPIQMCDALSRNMPSDLATIIANCLSHARRNFYDLADVFPSEVRYVLECLKVVYRVDAEAKQQGPSPEDRLRLHQQQSGPVMEELRQWLDRQFDQRLVEPNSSLGQAIAYMRRHWERLTLFLRQPGAPLDNNLAEQALKMAIRHRRNSLFYKTRRGAQVGDLYMSLIHTCYFSNVDPFAYLTELQRHHERVTAAPADWLPWNYQQQLDQDTSPAPA